MLSEYEIRQQICEIGKRLYAKGYVAAKHGNISYKYSDDVYFCTPSGVCKIFLTPDKICKVDGEGKKIGGGMYNPTSEVKLHIRMYKERPDIRALVHAQPPFSTAYAIKNQPINNTVLPENYCYLGVVPPGSYDKKTNEMSQAFIDCLKSHKAFLFQGGSTFSVGETLNDAFDNMDALEFYSKMNFIGSMIPDAPAVVAASSPDEDLVRSITEKIMGSLK